MADPQSSPPSLEELSTRGATALLLPWILGMAAAGNSSPREVTVFVHQPTRSVTLIEGFLDIDSLLREIQSKEGPSPASRASIESLPVVRVTEPGLECAICLAEYEVNGEEVVKEMPCWHRFHADCIDRWLGIHGSCPVCRFSMPAEEKKESVERGGWRIHVLFARGGRGSDPEPGTGTDMDTDADSGRDSEGEGEMEEGGDDEGNDELPAQDTDMENIN